MNESSDADSGSATGDGPESGASATSLGWLMYGVGPAIAVGAGGGAGVGAIFGDPGVGSAVGAAIGVVVGVWFFRRGRRSAC